ncbi:MAG: hypothetical protein K2H35_00395 [Muribaculaceae bacterium]|nr:hypothetical protein [Muribaculaceae bacterium]
MDVLSYVKEKVNIPSLMLGAGTVFAGTACAAIRGSLEWFAASLCVFFAIFLQMGANLMYFYTRAKRNYDQSIHPRYEHKEDVMNALHNRVLREGAFACFIIAGMLGLVIMATSPNSFWVFIAGIVLVGFIFIINTAKRPIFGTYRMIFITWLIFGPIGVLGTSLAELQNQAQAFAGFDQAPGLFVGPAMGFLACNVHLMYNYLMYRITPNIKGGVVYNLTPTGVRILMFINGVLMLAMIFFGVFICNFLKPLFASLPAFMGFALNTFLVIRMHNATIGELNFLNLLCKLNFLFTGMVMLIFWIACGYPSASMYELF